MITKFSEKAQKAIVIAESIAFDLGHSSVGSEHLLLSLLKIKDCPFSKILKTYHVSDEMIYDDVIRLFGEKDIQPFYMEYSEVVKRTLDDAMSLSEAKKEGKVSINSLSVALLMQKQSVAVELLNKYGKLKDFNTSEIINKLQGEEKKMDIELKDCQTFASIIQPTKEKIILGRDGEVKNALIGLTCKEKSNIAFTGKAGVGKTAIVEEIARVLKEEPIRNLEGYQVVAFSPNDSVAGTKYRGEFEDKINKFLETIKGRKVIVFIDECHTITHLGAAEGCLSLADILKPILARGESKFIVATTEDEYQRFICRDAALRRRFREVNIQEPPKTKVYDMIKTKVKNYSEYHHVNIQKKDIKEIIKLSANIPNRYFPDKALDIIDYTMAYCGVDNKPDFDMEVAKKYMESIKE